jgi:hypothetical protein
MTDIFVQRLSVGFKHQFFNTDDVEYACIEYRAGDFLVYPSFVSNRPIEAFDSYEGAYDYVWHNLKH